MDLNMILPRLAISLVMVSFGVHEFIDPKDWTDEYMPKWLKKLVIIPGETFMKLHASGNILLGLWFASGLFFIYSGWITFVWWLTILPFAFYSDWRNCLRDLAITAAILSLIIK